MTTTPEALLIEKYGGIPLLHVGDVKVVSQGGAEGKDLAFYGGRVKSSGKMDYNFILAAVPLQSDNSSIPKTLGQLPWVSVYLRSYFNLHKAKEVLPLDWEKLAASPEYPVPGKELPGGMWLKEIRRASPKSKSYVFTDPSLASRYLVTVESRLAETQNAHGLGNEYEFDMLLSHSHYNVAIEKLTA